MGRLPAVAKRRRFALFAAALSLVAACDDNASKAAARAAPRERSELVVSSGSMPEAKPANPAASATVTVPAALPRKLCEGQLTKPGHALPRKPLSRKAAPDTKAPAPSIPKGKWTWVNLWAAWCAPCKEELPRIRSFAAKLEEAGKDVHLVFISLDDDERQLEQFLSSPSSEGIRATYWLREGRERDEWLAGVGVGKMPDLPVQLLVDPRGKLRCTVRGAVEEADYPEILAAVSTL